MVLALTQSNRSKQKLTYATAMCNINHPKFSCRICAKNVRDKDKAVQCDLCKLWILIKCNNLLIIQITCTFKNVMNPGIV